ncbi:MAG TPA: hypothetical protein VFZ34_32195, partial [Blastocatellia bacterium]|nr:hypothetical protein [Blastocatellia bacterium]
MLYQPVHRFVPGLLLFCSLLWIGVAQPSKTLSNTTAPSAPDNAAQISQGPLTPPSKTEVAKPVLLAPASTRPFQVGEKLSFNVSWANFVTAARMEMEVA